MMWRRMAMTTGAGAQMCTVPPDRHQAGRLRYANGVLAPAAGQPRVGRCAGRAAPKIISRAVHVAAAA